MVVIFYVTRLVFYEKNPSHRCSVTRDGNIFCPRSTSGSSTLVSSAISRMLFSSCLILFQKALRAVQLWFHLSCPECSFLLAYSFFKKHSGSSIAVSSVMPRMFFSSCLLLFQKALRAVQPWFRLLCPECSFLLAYFFFSGKEEVRALGK